MPDTINHNWLIAYFILSAITIFGSIIPELRVAWRWVRFFDFPRAQIAVLALILTIVGFFFKAIDLTAYLYVFQALLIVSLVIQIFHIYPFTPLAKIEVELEKDIIDDKNLKLMILNVRMDNKNYQGFVDTVKYCNPDIILANEVNDEWVENIKEATDNFEHQVLKPLENTYGMAIYSKLPLSETEITFRVKDDVPSIKTCVQLNDGSKFQFYGIHPQPPDIHNDTYARDAELVITGIEVESDGLPAIVAGDLNDVAWSYTTRLFKRLSKMLDPRTGRGFYNTYSVFTPGFRYPLDHLFITKHFTLVDMQRLDACGSDHFPMLIQLQFSPVDNENERPADAEENDREHAQEILEDAHTKV